MVAPSSKGSQLPSCALGREDDFELPVRAQFELVDQGVGGGTHAGHDLQSDVPG